MSPLAVYGCESISYHYISEYHPVFILFISKIDSISTGQIQGDLFSILLIFDIHLTSSVRL